MPNKMKKKYGPKDRTQKMGYLVEECGEVLAAVGKTMRWGFDSVNPELPSHEQETNGAWILRELKDLKRAIKLVEKDLKEYK
jgi:NTP pyrophosphatase (non-canonical NTP hydrolase)